jgi:hypothetical protein
MNFGQALEALKQGEKVSRQGWNGKGMFIYLVNGQTINYDGLRNEAAQQLESNKDSNRGKRVKINSHIDMKAADGSIVVGWLASQTDMLAEDWDIIF